MRIAVLLLGAVTCLLAGASVLVPIDAAQQAKRTIVITPDYPYPAEGIPALWRESSVVVVGHVIASKQGVKRNALDVRASVPVVNTTFRVQRVLKPYDGIAKDKDISVDVQAGEAELDDTVVRVAPERWAPLRNGGRYLLFLQANDDGSFSPKYGPNGAYHLAGGAASTQGHSFSDSEDQLMAALRALAAGR